MTAMVIDEYRARLRHGEEITFTQQRWKMALALLGCLAFTIVGLALAFGDGSVVVKVAGWSAILFFGVIGIPALLLRTVRPTPQLRVSAHRGVWLTQGDASWLAWHDIEEVTPGSINGQKMVALAVSSELYERRFASSSVASRGMASANEKIIGRPGLIIPTGLSAKPADLADWLSAEHADRARARPGS